MSLLFALLPAVLLAPVPKDLEAQIKWRLAKGDVFYVSLDDRSGGTVTPKLAGVAQPPQQSLTESAAVYKYEVLAADGGKRVVKVTVVSLRVAVAMNGKPVEAPKLEADGATVTLTLDEQFAVTKVEGFKEFAEKLGGKAAAVWGGDTEKGYTEGLRQVFAVVPPKGVNGGAKWEQKASYPLGGMGSLNRTAKCAAADLKVATGHVVIDTVAEYGWAAPTEPADPKGAAPTVVAADLKAEKCKGTVTFDPKRGRLVASTEVMPFAGTMSMKVGETAVDMAMDMTVTRTLTVTDAPPKAK